MVCHHHEHIHQNEIGVFESDIIYGSVVYVPHPSANQFDDTIEWDTSRLLDVFSITWYRLCTSVANTYALTLNL